MFEAHVTEGRDHHLENHLEHLETRCPVEDVARQHEEGQDQSAGSNRETTDRLCKDLIELYYVQLPEKAEGPHREEDEGDSQELDVRDLVVRVQLHDKHVVDFIVSEDFDAERRRQDHRYDHQQESEGVEICQN